MGCQCSYQNQETDQVSNFSSIMILSIKQESPIQLPRKSMVIPNIFATDFESGNDAIFATNSSQSIQQQQITLQNILFTLNGKPDSIIEKRQRKKKQRKQRQRSPRLSMDDLEKQF